MKDTKQVIVMRTDLNMRKGKMCAQASHASLGAILSLTIENEGYFPECDLAENWEENNGEYVGPMSRTLYIPHVCNLWLSNSFTKICVGVNSEEELLQIYNKAKEDKIICKLIQDNGATEFHGIPTYTCCAIGPDFSEIIDEYTGTLKLL